MPKYYFHLSGACGSVEDEEGQTHHGAAEATRQAVKEVRGIIADEVKCGRPIILTDYLSVQDAQGAQVGRLRLADAVRFVI